MKVKELIKLLNGFKPEAEVLLSCDEELNTLFSDVQLSNLENSRTKTEDMIVMWGNSGSEVDE